MKLLSALLMQLVLAQSGDFQNGDKPLVTFNRENPGAEIGSKMAVKNKIQVVAEKFKRFDLKQDKKDNKLEKQKKKEGKKARKNKKKENVVKSESKFIIARPSVYREAPPPHPHQWLDSFFRTGASTSSSTDNGRLSERRELVRNAKRENSNRREFKTCQGLVRPVIKCENCAPGYPYYDCRKNSESQERFQLH